MTQLLDREQNYLAQFEKHEQEYKASGPSWLFPLRKAAIARLATSGFPDRKDEHFRYTQLNKFVKLPFFQHSTAGAVSAEQVQALGVPGIDGPQLVLVDGQFSAELSELGNLPTGVRFESMSSALVNAADELENRFTSRSPADDGAFAGLNMALFKDGFCLQVGPEVSVHAVLRVLHITTGSTEFALNASKNLIVLAAGSQATLVESYRSLQVSSPYFSSVGTEVVVGENAQLHHYKIQVEDKCAYHFANLRTQIAAGAHYGNHFYSFGAQLVRNELDCSLDGENGHCDLNGLFITDQNRLADCHTTLHHAQPHCTSWEMYRGILADQSSGNFYGKINVYPDAQKTDAKQSSSNLLLSEEALVNSRPCLEIYADDVKCTHGATVGQLDAEALFYMRSRGLSKQDARNMLIHAFAEEVVESIEQDALREHISALLSKHLPAESTNRSTGKV